MCIYSKKKKYIYFVISLRVETHFSVSESRTFFHSYTLLILISYISLLNITTEESLENVFFFLLLDFFFFNYAFVFRSYKYI